MLSVADQLGRIEAQLIGTGGVPVGEAIIRSEPGELQGELRLILQYPSGHRLYVMLAVDVTYGYPQWTTYRFHFQDEAARCVFRYDSSPHHPTLGTFPDQQARWRAGDSDGTPSTEPSGDRPRGAPTRAGVTGRTDRAHSDNIESQAS